MLAFTRPKSTTATVSRGNQSVSVEITARPASFGAFLQLNFPAPCIPEGASPGERQAALSVYAERLMYLQLEMALRPSGALGLDAENEPLRNRAQWAEFADKVRGRFREFYWTTEEVADLFRQVMELEKPTAPDEKDDAKPPTGDDADPTRGS